jgi:acetyl-CoA C-acetyltransferase
MADAVITSTARTPIGKAYRGSLNNTSAPALAAHAIAHAAIRSAVALDEVEDVFLGCAMQEGSSGFNVARQAAIYAGFAVTTAGTTIDRQCSSGLQAIVAATQAITLHGVKIAIAGGVESISLVQNQHRNRFRHHDPHLLVVKPELYMAMVETAENVSRRYGISREQQDAYSLETQQRFAVARAGGRLLDEVIPMDVLRADLDAVSQVATTHPVRLAEDEGPRPETTLQGLAALTPVYGVGKTVTAGNASQLSDGASACVVMDAKLAEQRGIIPLGRLAGFAVVGCEPDEMGIGPVPAVHRLLQRTGLTVADIDLWEINEAFAVQVIHCRDQLGIDPQKLNVSGGAIAMGHPYGMSGSRMVGHALIEGSRRKARRAVISMCIGGGMGAAALLEIFG